MLFQFHNFQMGFPKTIQGIFIMTLLYVGLFIKADNYDLLPNCKTEQVSSLNPWLYLQFDYLQFDYYQGQLNISLPKEGIHCQVQCPKECTCSLGEFTQVKVICTNGSTSQAHVIYPYHVATLSWGQSEIQGIEQNSFSGFAHSLIGLFLNNNSIHRLQPFVFSKLQALLALDLSNNMLKQVQSAEIFSGLSNLLVLDMASCSLVKIHQCTFFELEQLRILYLDNNRLTELLPGSFDGLGNLRNLWLDRNMLEGILVGVFNGLGNLVWLQLDHNMLEGIQAGVFNELGNLTELWLGHNMLTEIQAGVFDGLGYLWRLDLLHNMLEGIQVGVFNGLENLRQLWLNHNMLEWIQIGVFNGLGNLYELQLDHNMLEEIQAGVFNGLESLKGLYLSNNLLTHLYPDSFENMTKLDWLDLSSNILQNLPHDVFQHFLQLANLNLSNNALQQLGKEMFGKSLLTIDLRGNTLLWAAKEDFSLLNVSTTVFVDSPATCCFLTQATCISVSYESPFLTCRRLLGFDVLRVGIWVVSILAIVTNVFSIFTRYKHRAQSNKVQFLLITNLAISDFCMGIYLFILLSVDLYYKEYFPSHSEAWRNSSLCKVAGALSVLSSEASVFFIIMISIDRALAIKFPFRAHRLGSKYARKLVCVIWLTSIAISITSFVLSGIDPDIYDVSEICVGLPISRQHFFNTSKTDFRRSRYWNSQASKIEYKAAGSQVAMYFSIAIFTCLNLLCFSIVGVCYTSIFVMARKSTRRSGRDARSDKDIKMAKKMFLLVFTDFCCWVPIGVLSILVQAGIVTVDPVAYAWIATFVLPINSSMNPFLYTLGEYITNKMTCPCRRCRSQREYEAIEMRPRR